ncbi:NAD-dependent protein deacetylase sirtuin-1-like isoform X2 [Atheta coriaria]|uniref:NAD-dependent protein deacetylase sirtuin-1-like isoform X2 n=1 Tax=Dalotia coriaria TaxID=877792 RepID=UPI0031F38B01
MASYSDGLEHESHVKRIKLDLSGSSNGVPRDDGDFPGFSTTNHVPADPAEGYEASTMESIATPSHQSDSLIQTPTHPDISQDSIDADDDDNVSTVSELSGLSDLSGQDWKPMPGNMSWIQKQIHNGVDPRTLLVDLGVEQDQIPQFVDDMTLWKLIINMCVVIPKRPKLRHVNTLDDIVRLLKGAKKIIVLTGAGVSVSCGIPDFRSRDGIYSRLAIDFPDLPDPQSMFDITYFNLDPRPFFKFARDIYPGKFKPSPCHRFIKLLEKHKKLLRNYTQNIDTLEKVAEIERVIECHGSFATATCTKCGYKVTADAIRDIVLSQNIPVCGKCRPDIGEAISIANLKDREPGELRDLVSAGIMKPDIVFFGEGLPDAFHDAMSDDKNECDLLVVIGSSLKVRPVALIPSSLPAHVPQILINREPLPHCHFDVELLGDCDVIINHLCHMLGDSWKESIYEPEMLKETLHLLPISSKPTKDCQCVDESCINCDCKQKTLSIKERHMSVDSARDSGIGENSNFTDVETVKDIDEIEIKKLDTDNFLPSFDSELASADFLPKDKDDLITSGCSTSIHEPNSFANILDSSTENKDVTQESETNDDLSGYWEPKQKRSITDRLPPNSYYLINPSRYIFPGAEVYYDPDEKCSYLENTSSDSSDSDDSDAEIQDVSM